MADVNWIEEVVAMQKAGYPFVQVVSHEEARIVRELREAASGAGLSFDVLEQGTDPVASIRDVSGSGGAGFLAVRDLHGWFDDPRVVRALRDRVPLLERARTTVVLISPLPDLPTELVRDTALVDVPLPETDLLEGLVGEAARQIGIRATPTREIAAALSGLTFDEARRVLKKLLVTHGAAVLEDHGFVLAEKKRLVRASGALGIVDPGRTLEELGGAAELKRWLDERTRAFSVEARKFGLPAPRGLLLVGVQGCGKSLASRAIASYWSLPLARLDMGLLMGQASPEAALADVFKVVEAMSPVVLWIDEIEKVLQVDMKGASGRVLGSFVTWLSEKRRPVFTVATANEVDLLPPELARKGRFDEIFFFDLPETADRKEIFGIHLGARNVEADGLDLDDLAGRTEFFSGSEIEQVVIGGLYRAFAAQRPLSQADLVVAASETVPLYRTYEERIKALREWARGRARPAALARRRLDMFQKD